MHVLSCVNLVLAAATFVATACAVDKIHQGTAHVMRVAVLLVLVGALGELLSPWFSDAHRVAVDTVFLGGVAAFLFADRRGPFAPPGEDEPDTARALRQARLAELAPRIAAGIAGFTIAALFAAWAGVMP
jgi:hypothetical protein